LTCSCLCPAIEWLKRLGFAKSQDYLCSRHPISAFAMNQVAYYIEGTPCVFTFVSPRPHFWQITQQAVENFRSAREKRYRML
jgi:hypothetical protein